MRWEVEGERVGGERLEGGRLGGIRFEVKGGEVVRL